MSLLDKIADKALGQKGLRKKLAVFGSGLADYIAATYEEDQKHKAALRDTLDKRVEPVKDYSLYREGIYAGRLAESLALTYCTVRRRMPTFYLLSADIMIRYVNRLVSVQKFNQKFEENPRTKYRANRVGLIGTIRSLGYRLAGKLKRSEEDAKDEVEDGEDPFDDDAFQMPAAGPVADAEDDDDGPNFGVDDEEGSENEYF